MPQPAAYPSTDTHELTSDDPRDAPSVVAAAQHWAAYVPKDPAWKAAARHLAPDARRALLDIADAAWSEHRSRCGEAAADHALLAVMGSYVALADDLEPSDPADCVRIRRVISEGPAPSVSALMEATAARAADVETRHLARLVLAQRDLIEGRFDSAEAAYANALRTADSGHVLLRGHAATSYARLCLELKRDVEALVLARRGSEAARMAGDLDGALFGRLVETHVLLSFEDWPRLRGAIDRYAAEIGQAPPATRARLECGLAVILAELALGERRWDDAAFWTREADRRSIETASPAWSACDGNLTQAEICFGRGDLDGALREIELGLATKPDDPWPALFLSTWHVRVKAALGHADLAQIAAAWIESLESAAGVTVGHGYVLRAAQDGATALRAAPGQADLARRAYRLAASATLVRLAEVERFVREFPAYATPSAEERATIEDFRGRTEAREASLREAVAQLLRDEIRAGRWPLDAIAADGALIASCAWCGRIRNRGGDWLPMPETLHALPHDVVAVTHAICGDCTTQVCAELAD